MLLALSLVLLPASPTTASADPWWPQALESGMISTRRRLGREVQPVLLAMPGEETNQ